MIPRWVKRLLLRARQQKQTHRGLGQTWDETAEYPYIRRE